MDQQRDAERAAAPNVKAVRVGAHHRGPTCIWAGRLVLVFVSAYMSIGAT
eukprot:SAG11_NODE_892_length_6673_cov_7.963797_7_plen_50_part_00